MTTAYQHLRAYAATRVGLDQVDAFNALANAVQDQIDDLTAAVQSILDDANDPGRKHDPRSFSEPVTYFSLHRAQDALARLTGDYHDHS